MASPTSARATGDSIEILEWETAPSNARAQSVYDRFDAARSEWVTYTLAVTRR